MSPCLLPATLLHLPRSPLPLGQVHLPRNTDAVVSVERRATGAVAAQLVEGGAWRLQPYAHLCPVGVAGVEASERRDLDGTAWPEPRDE